MMLLEPQLRVEVSKLASDLQDPVTRLLESAWDLGATAGYGKCPRNVNPFSPKVAEKPKGKAR